MNITLAIGAMLFFASFAGNLGVVGKYMFIVGFFMMVIGAGMAIYSAIFPRD